MSKHSYIVKLKVEGDDESLKEAYKTQLLKLKENTNNVHKDSGFDLYIPSDISPDKSDTSILVDLNVKCAVYKVFKNSSVIEPSAYYLYPRSSISKTKFRLANSVGIIDSGYRGNLKIALDINRIAIHSAGISYCETPPHLKKGSRLVQICMPDLSSDFEVEIVDDLDETERGEGGFGSTGK